LRINTHYKGQPHDVFLAFLDPVEYGMGADTVAGDRGADEQGVKE
jgi:hypothetical protein